MRSEETYLKKLFSQHNEENKKVNPQKMKKKNPLLHDVFCILRKYLNKLHLKNMMECELAASNAGTTLLELLLQKKIVLFSILLRYAFQEDMYVIQLWWIEKKSKTKENDKWVPMFHFLKKMMK